MASENNTTPINSQFGMSLLQTAKATFNTFAKENLLYKSDIVSAFHSLRLELSFSELDQLLAGACVSSKRKEADFLTCGEFALSVVELWQYQREKHSPLKNSLVPISHVESEASSDSNHIDVFLGGSCNPTIWRIETAMPYLEKEGVTYYNPQVDDWYPELIQIEEDAKRNSNIKFFVFDSETRGIASLVETAFMASINWKLVVVLHYLSESKEVTIAGETLLKQEVKDLNRGRSFLCDILERLGIPVFDNLTEALKCTCDVIKGEISYDRMLQERKGVGHQYGNCLIQLREVFDIHSSTSLTQHRQSTPNLDADQKISKLVKRGSLPHILSVDFGIDSLTSSQPKPTLHPNSALTALEAFMKTRSLSPNIQEGLTFLDLIGVPIDYEIFCLLAAESKYQRANTVWSWGSSILTNLFHYTYSLVRNAIDLSGESDTEPFGNEVAGNSVSYDVFLGGTCSRTTWRGSIAIPLLEAHQISYYNPQLPPGEWSIRKMAEENLAKQTSKCMIFVISTHSPSTASMTEAAYLISSGKPIYLVIEDIHHSKSEFVYPLTAIACKDYNRGRAYLKKTADLFKVPVSTSVEDTIKLILKSFPPPTH